MTRAAVVDELLIRPRELLHGRGLGRAVIHGPPAAIPEQVRALVGIRLISRIPLCRLTAPIAHHDAVHDGPQALDQPLRLRAFFKRDVHEPAQTADERE
jgi:hypothetical protein